MTLLSVAIVLCALASPALAQDFVSAAPAWPPGRVGLLLERGLPDPSAAPVLEATLTRWLGIAELTTRAAAAGRGWRRLRVGLGLSQTGDPEVGWTTIACALGAADRRGGASLRAAVRRDRTSPFGFDDRGAAVGCEVGGGAWMEASQAIHVWASAPQVWMRGAAPPLVRPLEVGAAIDLGRVTLWLSRAGVAGAPRVGRAERAVGLSTTGGPIAVWLATRDQPLRGSIGIAGRVRGLHVAAEIESHPVLGETARASLSLGGGR